MAKTKEWYAARDKRVREKQEQERYLFELLMKRWLPVDSKEDKD